ncbi:hypothetical protein BT63DRAFT_428514, partial [Microthyrium microscopicum]
MKAYHPMARVIYDVKNDSELEDRAVSAFLDDYCVASQNFSPIGSILQDFKSIIVSADPASDLAKATHLTALSSIGKKSSSSLLLDKAREQYAEFLESFQKRLAHGAINQTPELLLVIVLLGIFELISATEEHGSSHVTHSRGVYAILSTTDAPLFTPSGAGCFRKAFQSVLQAEESLSQPLTHPLQSLDIACFKSFTVLRTARSLLSAESVIVDELQIVLREAHDLNNELADWAKTHLCKWPYRSIGKLDPPAANLIKDIIWPFGRIDVYADIYVSTVWNMYRQVRLRVIDTIINCASKLGMKSSLHSLISTAHDLVDDIAASLCFHLCADAPGLVRNAETGAPLCLAPGKSLGGLLLIQPIFIVSCLSLTPRKQRLRMNEALSWIADQMGIGQARLLLKAPKDDPLEVFQGFMLIWVGMLYIRDPSNQSEAANL